MLSRCLNASCGAPFHFLAEGRIFNIEHIVATAGKGEPQRFVEQYWLCGLCSQGLKVVVENGRVTTQAIHLELTVGKTSEEKRAPLA
ncbi:MAG: hypothetical protein ACHP7J_00445 [Terriglobales bacterium]